MPTKRNAVDRPRRPSAPTPEPAAPLQPAQDQPAAQGMTAMAGPEPSQRLLAEQELENEVATLPRWRLAADRRSISCTFFFPTFSLAVTFLSLITGLAELSAFYPEIALRESRISLRLASPQGRGLTSEAFTFARALEGASQLGGASAWLSRRAAAPKPGEDSPST
jgi:pterin-4a-carbinolamine dehydratase